MAITGSLSDKCAAGRVNEATTFFATTVLPDGMRRDGPGFEAAAMARLVHSTVRFNALHRAGKWDQSRFGIPIPQVDQMPAGLIRVLLARAADASRHRHARHLDPASTAEEPWPRRVPYRCQLREGGDMTDQTEPFTPPAAAEALARLDMSMVDAMRTQRAVRRLHLDPVDHDVLLPLLELSLKAPASSRFP